MSSEELITKQAEMVYAADPGVPGFAPRVWAYRNTIKALNWYSSVREKLDDPKYSSWFVKCRLSVLSKVLSTELSRHALTAAVLGQSTGSPTAPILEERLQSRKTAPTTCPLATGTTMAQPLAARASTM